MRLTKFTDYALRVLLYAASLEADRLATIEETAKVFDISRAHLKKVVLMLTQNGYLEGVRGRTGGYRLARPADQINLGVLIRVTEPDFGMVECFLPGNACRITQACRLPMVLNKALDNFLTTFDAYTLADMKIEARHFDMPLQPAYPMRGPKLSGTG
ncbi:MAG: RrF2 family transcriptional regulator [Alphaproteobacteria bacterium]